MKEKYSFFIISMMSLLLSYYASASALLPNQYIVVLKKTASVSSNSQLVNADTVSDIADRLINGAIENQQLVEKNNGTSAQSSVSNSLGSVYEHVIQGFSAELTPEAVIYFNKHPEVDFVVEDGVVVTNTIQESVPSWGLDRIDQRDLPLNGQYEYFSSGKNVHAYVIDTGLNLSHSEFTGRVGEGADFIDNDTSPNDCSGHGTHVSGTIAGTNVGVAKGVIIHPVRVFGCTGGAPFNIIISALDWVANHYEYPAVVNMSLGGSVNPALDLAVNNIIAEGVTVVVSAGNNNVDACRQSPARVPNAITVASSTASDQRSNFSNKGECVDIFAPGSEILSAWWTGDTAEASLRGTSMAAPHVAGAAALLLESSPGLLPEQIAAELINTATVDVITNPGTGTPNRLLRIPVNGIRDEDWQFCSGEFDVCHVPVPALVRYGLDGQYFLQPVEDSINCRNSVFGNPTLGRKRCDYLLSDIADYDNDGVVDSLDIFPADSTETSDTDGDGIGDNADPFPEDSNNGNNKNWAFCTGEFGSCHVPVPALVRYGLDGKYFFQQVDDVIECRNNIFGNPTFGRKRCDYLLSDTADYDNDGVADSLDRFPADSTETADTDGDGLGDNADPFPDDFDNGSSRSWTFCVGEFGVCRVPIPSLVRYGLNGKYFFKEVDESVECRNHVFGNPIGARKICEYLLSSTADFDGDGVVDALDAFPNDATETVDTDNDGAGDNADPFPESAENEPNNVNWTYCTNEGLSCVLPARALVRYGANGRFFFKIAVDNLVCDNATFGDPIGGIFKACDYLLLE